MRHMKHFLTLFLFLFSSLAGFAADFKEKILQAEIGDYIVTHQGGNYSLLLVRHLTPSSLIYEEITIPDRLVTLSKHSWQEWISQKAPGNTSWVTYEIDLEKGRLIEGYSHSRNGWLFLDENEVLFPKLLILSLSEVDEKDRRRIGQPPAEGEADHRRLWNPALTFEGKKIEKPHFQVWQGKWPQDNSQLSGCNIELFFSDEPIVFPLPFWIEIKGVHYALKVPVIDSGKGLSSPYPLLPHRPMQLTTLPKLTKKGLFVHVTVPSYYENPTLFAIDLAPDAAQPINFTIGVTQQGNKEALLLEVPLEQLKASLIEGHTYRWVVSAEGSETYLESPQLFFWKGE